MSNGLNVSQGVKVGLGLSDNEVLSRAVALRVNLAITILYGVGLRFIRVLEAVGYVGN